MKLCPTCETKRDHGQGFVFCPYRYVWISKGYLHCRGYQSSKPTTNAEGTFDFICLKCGAGCWMGDEQCSKCKSDLGEKGDKNDE